MVSYIELKIKKHRSKMLDIYTVSQGGLKDLRNNLNSYKTKKAESNDSAFLSS